MRTVAFFSHKGGVGKTTLLFNVALALAEAGRRVLLIDGDAQANLTAAALTPNGVEDAYANRLTIADAFTPLVDNSGNLAVPNPIQIRDTAWIIPGHIELSRYEDICPRGWNEGFAGNNVGALSITAAPFHLAKAGGANVNADLVFFDVGPNVGAMNRNMLLACDGFVVPLAPDLFSLNALTSVGERMKAWVEDWDSVKAAVARRNLALPFELPEGKPSPLGYVSQQFSTYRQVPALAYERWLGEIPNAYRDKLVARLEEAGVRIPPGPDLIGQVRNLASLVPMAQEANAAIFELRGSEARGAQFTRARDTLEMFSAIGTEIEERLAFNDE